MSDLVKLALIAAIPGYIAAFVSCINVILNFRNKQKIQEVHLLLNSRLTELVAASEAVGRIAEQSIQKEKNL